MVAAARNNPARAVAQFEEALKRNPNLADVLADIVAVRLRERKPELAIERCREQLARTPNNPFAHALLGQVYLVTGKVPEAEASFKKAVALNPNLIGPYLQLAAIYRARGTLGKAETECREALKRDPKNIAALMTLGVLQQEGRRPKEAIATYEKLLAVDANFAPAANNLAWLLAHHGGNIDVALGWAQTARRLMPEDPAAADTLGWIYYQKNVPDAAIPLLQEAAEKLKNPAVEYHLGMAYYKKGDKAQARQHLSQALGMSRNFEGAAEAQAALTALGVASRHGQVPAR
jgi:tetratricopeptide (TPR) repeat protein